MCFRLIENSHLPFTTSQRASAYFFTPNKTKECKNAMLIYWSTKVKKTSGCIFCLIYILPDTWESSVILDVGLDSSLLERLLSDVHDLLRCS